MQEPQIKAPPGCIYPGSHPTARNIHEELAAIAANQSKCSSIYLGATVSMSLGGENHFQGMAQTHKLSDGSIYFFLVRSDLDSGSRGNVLQYRYAGPTDQEHVLKTSPPRFVPLLQIVLSADQHPSDSTFLPEVNDLASELRQTACSPSARRDPSSWMHSNRTRYSRFR
jgi:hypothetical protein